MPLTCSTLFRFKHAFGPVPVNTHDNRSSESIVFQYEFLANGSSATKLCV